MNLKYLLEGKEGSGKIERSAFLYLEPPKDSPNFAQCGTCSMFTGSTCTILGKNIEIKETDSCGLYVPGEPVEKGTEKKLLTPDEAGLVRRDVRCENCTAFLETEGKCKLFQTLNKSHPDIFELKEEVKAQGCCNAQTPKE